MVSKEIINLIEILTLENEHIKTKIAPKLGGKIISVFNKQLNKEFLWHNDNLPLVQNKPDDDYDSNFWGGIDELLPNDIPETVNGIDYPDHGELWTTSLKYKLENDIIKLSGYLNLSELYYQKQVSLIDNKSMICLDYKIKNMSRQSKDILWKLHASLISKEGDQLTTDAKKAKVVDLEYSRFSVENEFRWPIVEKTDASIVPSKNNGMDFFYLYDSECPEMSLITNNGKHRFSYLYDNNVFPFQWYFASYGGFLNHHVSILEPSTNMPVSINEAKEKSKCLTLKPGQELKTRVIVYAGEN
jgi:hypothetical protein